MYDDMPTSESYNHLNIIITDLVVNQENEEKYEIKLRTFFVIAGKFALTKDRQRPGVEDSAYERGGDARRKF